MIVRRMELPHSCIVAVVIYVQLAVDDARFSLNVDNWQPTLLAAFVVAALKNLSTCGRAQRSQPLAL